MLMFKAGWVDVDVNTSWDGLVVDGDVSVRKRMSGPVDSTRLRNAMSWSISILAMVGYACLDTGLGIAWLAYTYIDMCRYIYIYK